MQSMSQRLLRLSMNRRLPSEQLRAIKSLRAVLDEEEREAVAALRKGGATWDAIGAMLGITPQGAHKRFTK